MSAGLRRAAWSLALLAVVVVVVRIIAYPWPVSDPVHSRWLTLEALLEDRSFAIGYRAEAPGGYRDVGRMQTLPGVDVMLDPDTLTFYSSKPPFLQVLYAPLLKGIAAVTGASGELAEHRASLMRLLLLLVHALPFALSLAWLTQWWLRTETAGAALFLVVVAGFGTFLTTFSNALSNHVPATFATLCALVGLARVVVEGARSPVWFLLAGLSAGFAAALEYPAGTLVVAVLVLLARCDWQRALAFTLPAALLPLLFSHGIDYVVFGEPLFFLDRGSEWFHYAGSYWNQPGTLDRGEPSSLAYAFHFLVGHHGTFVLVPLFGIALIRSALGVLRGLPRRTAVVVAVAWPALVALVVVMAKEVNGWWDYIVVPLGLLTLLPLLLPGPRERSADDVVGRLLLSCALPTLAFYLAVTKNYGGLTAGPRWLLWLTPLVLLAFAPVARALVTSARGRLALVVLLALSAFAVWFPGSNPYRNPWTYAAYQALLDEQRPRPTLPTP